MLKSMKVLCVNRDLVVVEPDHSSREVTHNQDATLVMVVRDSKVYHAETAKNMPVALDIAQQWVNDSGGFVAATGEQT